MKSFILNLPESLYIDLVTSTIDAEEVNGLIEEVKPEAVNAAIIEILEGYLYD